MKNTIKYLILLIIYLVCGVNLQAQNYTFRNVVMSDGLSGLLVNAIYKDSEGFVWLGTDNCLDRFDGVKVRHYEFRGVDSGRKKRVNCITETAVCYQETDLILGLKYLNDLADELGLPLVMCITIGSNLGGHVGTLPLPALLGSYSLMPDRIAVVGTGNEADKRHHYFNTIQSENDRKTVEIRVGENVSGFTLELWVLIHNLFSI